MGVVLYVCAPEGTDSAPLLLAARTYALARDFRVLHERVDTGPLDGDFAHRPAWAELRSHLTGSSAQAEGLIFIGLDTGACPRWADAVVALGRPDLFVQHASRTVPAVPTTGADR
ncbi:hypothetical protein ACWCWD_26895 [Streptomyces sp. NPDC001493]